MAISFCVHDNLAERIRGLRRLTGSACSVRIGFWGEILTRYCEVHGDSVRYRIGCQGNSDELWTIQPPQCPGCDILATFALVPHSLLRALDGLQL